MVGPLWICSHVVQEAEIGEGRRQHDSPQNVKLQPLLAPASQLMWLFLGLERTAGEKACRKALDRSHNLIHTYSGGGGGGVE